MSAKINSQPVCQSRSRGGLNSKIHALVDTNGLPLRLANLGNFANEQILF
jgi:hypothetical protein